MYKANRYFADRVKCYAILFAFTAFTTVSNALTISNGYYEATSLSSTTVDMYGQSELHITDGGTPISGSIIDMHDIDSWVFLHQVKPSTSVSSLLSQFRVNGAAAVNNSNVRVAVYGQGSVIMPYPADFKPLEVFDGENFTGDSASLSPNTDYGAVLGGKISSFILKRGYTATLASSDSTASGSGTTGTEGINYVAADGDLKISILPDHQNNNVKFIRVWAWDWVAKKGTCDAGAPEFNATWRYNWDANWYPDDPDWEYVGIKQQRWWPGTPSPANAGDMGMSHFSGYNEPDNPVEDSYASLDGAGVVGAAIWSWPDLEWSGLRIGSPAPTTGSRGLNWLADFMGQAATANRRVDYVAVHYYPNTAYDGATAASWMYSYLKGVYDAYHLPIWVTEFNNGANWTSGDPTFTQNRDCIEAMINMMDNAPWVERYSVYSAVEEVRQLYYNAGGYTPMGAMYRDHVSPLAYQQIIPAEGVEPTASYSFENNLDDSSGSGNHAVSHDYPDYVAGHGGGTAIQFDGVDDHVILPDSLSDSTDFTFAAWVYWNGGGINQHIFDFGIIDSANGTSGKYMVLTPNSGSGTTRFAITTSGWNNEQALTSSALPQNEWTHVAVTISGSTGRLYINGAQVAINSTMSINPADLNAIHHYLGRSTFPSDPYFSGKMDDVIFKNSAMSGTQIEALAAGNQPPQISTNVADGGNFMPGVAYSGSVAEIASDPESSAITYSKVYGPSWLSVASDGTLSGTPGSSVTTEQTCTIRAADTDGAINYFILSIQPGSVVPISLVNPDFELPDSGKISDGFDGAIDIPAWNDVVSTVNDSGVEQNAWWGTGHNGGYAAVFMGRGSANDRGAYQMTGYTIQEGDVFSIGFWSRNIYNGTQMHVVLFGDVVATPATLLGSTAGSVNDSWQYYEFQIAATSGSIGTELGVQFVNAAGPANDSWVAVDDVTLNVIQMNDVIPPAAPSGLSAVSGDGAVSLDWASHVESVNYTVHRSTLSESNYTDVASGLVTSDYTDNSVTNGTRYYYMVTASDSSSNESDLSLEVSATPSAAVASNEFYISGNAIFSDTNLLLTVPNSVLGHDYVLKATETLMPPLWTNILVESGTGSNLVFGIPVGPAATNRYFKLDVQRQ